MELNIRLFNGASHIELVNEPGWPAFLLHFLRDRCGEAVKGKARCLVALECAKLKGVASIGCQQ